jgi:hypothetical protein
MSGDRPSIHNSERDAALWAYKGGNICACLFKRIVTPDLSVKCNVKTKREGALAEGAILFPKTKVEGCDLILLRFRSNGRAVRNKVHRF